MGAPISLKSFKQIPSLEKGSLLVSTLNKMGFMTLHIDPYTDAFHRYCLQTQGVVLDIGAAYGIATIPALETGAYVFANDLDFEHLKILKLNTSEVLHSRLTLLPGNFPHEINLPPNCLDAVFSSRVIHFFTPQEIEITLKKAFLFLKPEAKVFLISETPYLHDYRCFIPIFEKRKREGHLWPGVIENVAQYGPARGSNIPNLLHFFDVETLSQTVERAGFRVEKCSFLDRRDYPEDLRLDGRESVGLIATKPC